MTRRGGLMLVVLVGALCLVLVGIGPSPRYLEEIQVGGGYGDPVDGGASLEKDGDIITDGSVTASGFNGVDLSGSNPWNAIANASVESWSAGTSSAPDGFTVSGATVAREAAGTDARFGSYSMKLTTDGVGEDKAWQSLELKPDTTYTFSVWYKTNGSAEAGFDLEGFENSFTEQAGDATEWTRWSATFDPGSDGTGEFVVLAKSAAGSVHFDGFMVVEGEEGASFCGRSLLDSGDQTIYGSTTTLRESVDGAGHDLVVDGGLDIGTATGADRGDLKAGMTNVLSWDESAKVLSASNQLIVEAGGQLILKAGGTNNNVSVRARGAGAVDFNYNDGTGGLRMYDGLASLKISMSGDGAAGFSGGLALGTASAPSATVLRLPSGSTPPNTGVAAGDLFNDTNAGSSGSAGAIVVYDGNSWVVAVDY